MSTVPQIGVIPIVGLGEISLGDDLGVLIAGRCEETSTPLLDGDLVVVAQKVVSKAEGAIRVIADQMPTEEVIELAIKLGKDPRTVQIILDQSKRVVRAVPGVLIVETVHGFICANAGVDQSNIQGEGVVTLLPEDSDRSAREIRDQLRNLTGCEIGVLISDTFNRPWREGSINVAIGVAGFDPINDLRGSIDDFDREMIISTVSLADEVASSAQLVMGESGRVPVAIVRGVDWNSGEYSADRLLRPAERDLFR
jgi:coenzyme F420-0:L-glutamate ligase/coenzyme F420-1:gamma-L-glutamate ligase